MRKKVAEKEDGKKKKKERGTGRRRKEWEGGTIEPFLPLLRSKIADKADRFSCSGRLPFSQRRMRKDAM